MTIKWFARPAKPAAYAQEVRLPGIGVVRVDLDKHIDDALKRQANEYAGKRKNPSNAGGKS